MALLDFVNHTLFLGAVGFCGLAGLVIAAERAFFLLVRANVAPGPFMAGIQRAILAGNIDHALHLCAAEPRAPLANVVKAALHSAHLSRDDIELAIEQATADAAPDLHKGINYLATIANVVTMFGLLGTIVGLIQSFDAVSQAEGPERQAMLAKGIATAMYTTGGGIAVAIPTLAAHAFLAARANGILDDTDRSALKVMMLLLARKSAPSEPAAAE